MSVIIQADESGALLVPPGSAPPGAHFTMETLGSTLVLRRYSASPEDWWATTTPAQRAAWFQAWIESLPPSPTVRPDSMRRDTIYD
jgi:hypothetical protein